MSPKINTASGGLFSNSNSIAGSNPPRNDPSVELTWEWQTLLAMALGSATLAIRGSEKSIYGKFFEKLILGSVLSVMGFNLSEKNTLKEKNKKNQTTQ